MMTLLDHLVEKFHDNPDVYGRYLIDPSLQELVDRMIESYYMEPEYLLDLDIRGQLTTIAYCLESNPALYKDCQTEFYLTLDEHILKARVAGTELDDIPAMELKMEIVNSIIQLDIAQWLDLQLYALSNLYSRTTA